MDGNFRSQPNFTAERNPSAIYWGPVIAGAFVTAAFWLTLTMLGIGFGLSNISPWTSRSASSDALTAGALIWLLVTQIIASGLGGYLVGRWRLKWPKVHTTEVCFRDTAHGLLVWAVAVVGSAALLGSALTSIASSGATLAASTNLSSQQMQGGYNQPYPGSGDTSRYSTGPGPSYQWQGQGPGPQRYAQETKRVAPSAFIWMFIALLVGAFCSSLAALIGGRQRDKLSEADVGEPKGEIITHG